MGVFLPLLGSHNSASRKHETCMKSDCKKQFPECTVLLIFGESLETEFTYFTKNGVRGRCGI